MTLQLSISSSNVFIMSHSASRLQTVTWTTLSHVTETAGFSPGTKPCLSSRHEYRQSCDMKHTMLQGILTTSCSQAQALSADCCLCGNYPLDTCDVDASLVCQLCMSSVYRDHCNPLIFRTAHCVIRRTRERLGCNASASLTVIDSIKRRHRPCLGLYACAEVSCLSPAYSRNILPCLQPIRCIMTTAGAWQLKHLQAAIAAEEPVYLAGSSRGTLGCAATGTRVDCKDPVS